MTTILTSFENRLGKLEETILPVYNVTKNLQRKQQNLEVTLNALETVLSHYGASQDTCNLIHLGPSESGIVVFLEALDKLKKAKDYFLNYNAQSVELENVTSLFNTGCETLNNYFKTLIKKHSAPMKPVDLLDIIYIEEDSSNEDCPSIKQLPPVAREELGTIAQWLDNNLRREYIQIYGDERSDVVFKSIQLLKDHQKSGSLGSEQSTKTKYREATPQKKTTSARLQSIFERKANKMLQKATQLGQTALRKNSIYAENLVPEEYANDSDQDLENYLVLLLGLQKLLLWERQLMKDIIPSGRSGEVFARLAQSSIEMVVRDAENITSKVLRNISRKEWSAALGIFSALKQLQILQPDVERTYDPTQRQQMLNVLGKLQQTGARALEQFLETVKGETGSNLMTTSTLSTTVPKDATVHELTSNAIWFVEHLQYHVDPIGSILYSEQSYVHILETLAAHKNLTAEQKNKILLGIYVRKVLTELNYTIVAKADQYNDQATKQLFKLNNVNYILKSLQRSNLLDLISITETDTERRYNKMIQDLKLAYQASWSRLLGSLSLDEMPRPINGKCKEKERQVIKERFSTFNKELEDAVKVQRKITIPDVILREGIKRDNTENIVPAYTAFFDL